MTPRALAIALALATTAVSFEVAGRDGQGGDAAPAGPAPSAAATAGQAPEVPAADQPDQDELLQQAERAEAEDQPARAAELYRSAIEAKPSSRLARRARARLGWLEARSEGGYQPLAELMRARRAASTPERASIEAFEARIASYPNGLVRREALALVAATYLHRLDDPARALAAYQAWADSPDLPEGERQLAASGVALAAARLGRSDSGRALAQAGLGHRAEAVYLRAERIGAIGSWIAYAVVAAFVAAALWAGGWRGLRPAGLRRALSPARLAIAVYALALPLAIVWLYDHRLLAQLGLVVAACALALLLASVLGSGLEERPLLPRWRRSLAALAAVATLGAAFVAVVRARLLFDVMLSLEGG